MILFYVAFTILCDHICKVMVLPRSFCTALAQWLRCCVTNRKDAGSIPAGVTGFFIGTKSLRSHYGPGVDSASNRNEYQEYLLGQRRPLRKADNLPPSCAVVTKSGTLNFLEPSGCVQACNGTALPFTLILYRIPWHEPRGAKSYWTYSIITDASNCHFSQLVCLRANKMDDVEKQQC